MRVPRSTYESTMTGQLYEKLMAAARSADPLDKWLWGLAYGADWAGFHANIGEAKTLCDWRDSGVSEVTYETVCAVVDVKIYWSMWKDDAEFARGFVDGACQMLTTFNAEKLMFLSRIDQADAKIEELNRRIESTQVMITPKGLAELARIFGKELPSEATQPPADGAKKEESEPE